MITANMQSLIKTDRVLQLMAEATPTWWWQTPANDPQKIIAKSGIDTRLVTEAAARFKRFAPWFQTHFAGSQKTGGILESELWHESSLTRDLNALSGQHLQGSLWFKRDDLLPVSGSVKARGGIHEVLEVAERIALDHGAITIDGDYQQLDSAQAKQVFAKHGMVVGSTGNLGLSIGIVAAKLGFKTTVHMSADAREWKKSLLRSRNVTVVEHPGDFTQAVDAGRAEAAKDEAVHFVDDESSLSLFSGYAVAANRLKAQLTSFEVMVDNDHPLFVYLPCGVGGAPGGLTFGLKQTFGKNVHIVLVEPTETPAMSLGVRTGLHEGVSAHDIGLSGLTTADGLAVGRPSGLVGKAIGPLFDGFVTLTDAQILAQLGILDQAETIRVEPSAAAGVSLPWLIERDNEFLAARQIDADRLKNATHIVWLTGGSMVPPADMQQYVAEGHEALAQVGPAIFSIAGK